LIEVNGAGADRDTFVAVPFSESDLCESIGTNRRDATPFGAFQSDC
jgi:hypothetical protein